MELATPPEEAFNEIVENLEPLVVRNSIKYKITPITTKLMVDFVFANDPQDAEFKARAFLEIPDGEPITIQRVWESSGVNGSAIKGYTASPHMEH